jgi:hypothetical protein
MSLSSLLTYSGRRVAPPNFVRRGFPHQMIDLSSGIS